MDTFKGQGTENPDRNMFREKLGNFICTAESHKQIPTSWYWRKHI